MLDHFQNMSVLHRKVRGPQGPWMSLGAVVSSKRDADVIFFSMKFSVDLWLGHESASQLVSSCLEIPSCANLVGQRLFSVSTTRGREVSLCGCRCIHLVHGNAWMEAGKDCDLTEPNSQAKNLTFRHSKSSFFLKILLLYECQIDLIHCGQRKARLKSSHFSSCIFQSCTKSTPTLHGGFLW